MQYSARCIGDALCSDEISCVSEWYSFRVSQILDNNGIIQDPPS